MREVLRARAQSVGVREIGELSQRSDGGRGSVGGLGLRSPAGDVDGGVELLTDMWAAEDLDGFEEGAAAIGSDLVHGLVGDEDHAEERGLFGGHDPIVVSLIPDASRPARMTGRLRTHAALAAQRRTIRPGLRHDSEVFHSIAPIFDIDITFFLP